MSYICFHVHEPCKPAKAKWGSTTCDECSEMFSRMGDGGGKPTSKNMFQKITEEKIKDKK